MSETDKLQLKTTSLINVPLQAYIKDFTFIVNGDEFKVNHLISDLLSPIICRNHSNDPTFDRFEINTQARGDFLHVLNLLSFNQIDIQPNELEFMSEVIEILGNESIDLIEANGPIEITIDNILSLIEKHEKFPIFFSKRIEEEIDFISSHFYELIEKNQETISKLSLTSLMKIIQNSKLQLKNEDQLIQFLNTLYSQDNKYAILYESVIFSNISSDHMKEFLQIFDFDDISFSIWSSIVPRLYEPKIDKGIRYKQLSFVKKEKEEFAGIVNYLYQNENGNGIKIEASTARSKGEDVQNILLFNDQSKYFVSDNHQNSYICLDFCKHKVIPTDYTIRSTANWGSPNPNPKSWELQGSIDGQKWDKLSEEKNVSILDCGGAVYHTWPIQCKNNKEYKYIKFIQTNINGHKNNHLVLDSFEIYGTLIL